MQRVYTEYEGEYIMGRYFGTDGFRGEANVGLTVDHAFKIGRFLGWYYGQDHHAQVVIGKDTRRSSYMFEYALAAGLTASGADAYLLHVTTTPSVSYVVRTEKFDCGIMVSASHNPYYDNGIKIISGTGSKMDTGFEQKIEDYIDGKMGELPYALRENIGRTVDFYAGRNRYIGHLISIPTRSFKNYKVALDCANGSSSSIAKSVFDALGAQTYVIHNEPDGTNINRDCGSTHIDSLRKYVKENHFDCGFAYDGDADRCLAVDENGNLVDGDQIMYICGKSRDREGKLYQHTIVCTVMSNLGFRQSCEKAGMHTVVTAVGDRNVFEEMQKNGYDLGGEQSGHVIFMKHAMTGDGILTSLMVMGTMIEEKASLGRLASECTILPQVLKNVRVSDKAAAQADPEVQKAVKAAEDALGDDGRILVRESGTEPLIRVMVEAGTTEICNRYVDSVCDVIRSRGFAVED